MHADGEVPDGVANLAVDGDATRLPFPDASFERVIASEVLEHIPTTVKRSPSWPEFSRPGGTLAVTVPAAFAERLCWALSDDYPAPRSPGGHVRIYTRDLLRERLRDAGLTPTRCPQRRTRCTRRIWWLRCAVGLHQPDRSQPRSSPPTTACCAGTSQSNRRTTRCRRAVAQPAHRQESGGLRIEARPSRPRIDHPPTWSPSVGDQPRCR